MIPQDAKRIFRCNHHRRHRLKFQTIMQNLTIWFKKWAQNSSSYQSQSLAPERTNLRKKIFLVSNKKTTKEWLLRFIIKKVRSLFWKKGKIIRVIDHRMNDIFRLMRPYMLKLSKEYNNKLSLTVALPQKEVTKPNRSATTSIKIQPKPPSTNKIHHLGGV